MCVFVEGEEKKDFFCVRALFIVVGGRMGWGLFSLLVLFSDGTNLQYMGHS